MTLAAPHTRMELDEALTVMMSTGPMDTADYERLAAHGRRVPPRRAVSVTDRGLAAVDVRPLARAGHESHAGEYLSIPWGGG
jgi:hypothetical protein